jgi:hypothetical protein
VKGPPNQNLPEGRIKGGTIVFAVFAVISLIVSLVNGLVPIYLIEAASWGGLAWYWQRRNRHSETAKSIVVILAAIVIIGEVIDITVRHNATRQPTPLTALLQSNDQPSSASQPTPACPSGIPSGAQIVEIPSDQVTATSGQLWYVPPDKLLGEQGGWYFHFTVTNNAKDFCVTAVEYSVQLEPDNGVTITGQGKKHLGPLSQGWIYAPQERDPDDRVTFPKAASSGALSSWNVTKVYGFSQPVR